jgi:MoxR-like ATPase
VAETGEVIPVAPDVVFLLADNTNGTGDVTGQYEATRRLNRATLDRCAVFVAFDYLDPAQETAVIAARSGLSKKAAAMLAKFAALTRQKAQGGDVSHGIGLRRLMALAECLAIGTDPSVAFQLSVIEGAPYDDKEPLRQLWTGSVDTNALSAAVKVAA